MVQREGNKINNFKDGSGVTRLGDLLDFGQLLKPLAAINLPKTSPFLGNFCKGVKIYHFSREIVFGQLLWTFGDFFLVTLDGSGSDTGKGERAVTSDASANLFLKKTFGQTRHLFVYSFSFT